MVKEIVAGNVKIGGMRPLVVIAGPCVIEDEKSTLRCAERLMTITNGLSIPLIFKASFDKAEYLARAAVATGVDGVFLEVHEDPEQALCDGPNSMRLSELPGMLKKLKAIDAIVK